MLTLLVFIPILLAVVFLVRHDVLFAFLSTFALYFAALGTSIFVYRVSPFHPLARHPGPAIAKVSALWIAYIASRGKRHLYLHRLHEEYGDIVRIGILERSDLVMQIYDNLVLGPNELSIRDASAIMPLMGTTGMPKGPGMKGRVQHQALPLIACQNPVEHTQRRRPWNRAFSTNALKEYQPIIARRAVQLLDALQSEGRTVDLAQWISFFTCVLIFPCATPSNEL